MVEALAPQLFDFDPAQPEIDFRCGNSKFSDMIWDFNGYVDIEHLRGARLMLKFHFLQHKPRMLTVVKWFMHHELITGKIQTAKRSLDGMVRFVKFINEYSPEIDSFADITQEHLRVYFEYLLHATSETRPDQPLSATSIKKAALAIKDILLKGSIKGWEVPKDVRYVQVLYDDMIINNKSINRDASQAEKEMNEKISDEELVHKIVKTALADLDKDENILVATSIVITSQLGLRISEFITMRNAAIEQLGGDTMLVYYTGKLHHEPVRVTKPANALVVTAINKLQQYALPLQKESGLPYLFLTRQRNKKGYPVILVSHSNWGKNYLRPWIAQHAIRDKSGELVDFTSHTFRHAFATYALKGGASVEVISELMNHKSIRGTTHYAHVIQEDVKKRFAEVLHEGAILVGKQALQIKEKLKTNNPFLGKTADQVDKIRKAHKIQILSHGLCTHHPMRNEPCVGDGVCMGCRNFLTTPEFLSVHKGRLDKVREQLAIAPTDGPYEAKLKTIETYLVGIIADLESQMNYQGQDTNESYGERWGLNV
jgi:integrase